MSGVHIDASELDALAVELGHVAGSAVPLVDAVMKKAAQNIADEMRADAQVSRHFRQVARTITYDRETRVGQVAYEIGPDRDRGASAGLAGAYLGWSNGGGGSLSLDSPVEHEEPRLLRALDEALGRVL